jgi:hypothetical protein
MHRKVAAALVAALALAVASCGGSEKKTLARAQLVRQIELACRQGSQASQKQARANERSSDRSNTGFVIALATGQQVVMDKIDDFEASGAAKADFDAFKDGMQQRLDLIKRLQSASRADYQRTMRAVQRPAEATSRRIQAAERRLGVSGCI